MKKALCALLALLLCLMLSACGKDELLKKTEDYYYYDGANVLSDAAKAVIYYNSTDLYKACGAQIVVATVTDIGSYTMSDYATRLFNSWEVGDKNKNNGFLLAMLIKGNPDDGNYYLSTGAGAMAIVSNSAAGDLLDEYLEPYFSVGYYEQGTLELYRALFERISAYYGLNLSFRDEAALRREGKLEDVGGYVSGTGSTRSFGGGAPGGGSMGGSGNSGIILLIIVAAVVALIVILAVRSNRRRAVYATGYAQPARSAWRRPAPPPPPPVAPGPGPAPSPRRTGSFWGAGTGYSTRSRTSAPSPSRSGSWFSRSSSSRTSTSRTSTSRTSSIRTSSGRSSFGGGRAGGGRSSGGGAGRR